MCGCEIKVLAAPPSNLTRLYYNGSAAKFHSTTTQTASYAGYLRSVSKVLTEELRSRAENGEETRNFLAPSALASPGKTARSAQTLCRLLCIAATTASVISSCIFLILLTVANPVHFRALAHRQLYLFEQYVVLGPRLKNVNLNCLESALPKSENLFCKKARVSLAFYLFTS